ncbi:hypothetical protein [Thermomonospora echinospora]|uniref:hypothetical protein n=1 Tax=Thermomonospora echinospora TaxID=1992 RepID=UPI0011AFDED7|nr:hypothetical protein [Thermomonospora echinospora]
MAEGCPAGRWDGFTYKQSAYALADRGLVTIKRRRNSWNATITDHGRYYLEHGRYQPAEQAVPPPRQHPRRATREQTKASPPSPAIEEVSAQALLAKLTHGGVLTVPDPPAPVRGRIGGRSAERSPRGWFPKGMCSGTQAATEATW